VFRPAFRASGAVLAVIGGEMSTSHSSIDSSSVFRGHASVGLFATAVGAFIGLCVLATKELTGVARMSGEAGIVRLSAVLIQTGAMLVGIGTLFSVVRRIFPHYRSRR